MYEKADMAQLVEQRIRNAWVTSSSLVIGSFLTHGTVAAESLQGARGNSSVGRASASQAECRGFESRLPLIIYIYRHQTIFTTYSSQRL